MKVIVAVFLAIGSVSALGSGPYLPSGWRPQGPAFFLPGEVQKPADAPLKEIIVLETEASGSDSLREYGPPKVAEVISQALPDVVTDQTFLVVEDKGAVIENVVIEENVEQKSELVQEQTTEAQITEEVTLAYERIADIELQTDVTTALYAEEAKSELNAEVEARTEEVEIKSEEIQAKEEIEATVSTVEKLEQVVVQEVEAVEAVEVGVKNIAEALINLETEIKSEQAQSEAVAEIKINQESSGSAQVPEGFLEYGPPGFREYGPPKGDELLRSAAVIQEPSNSVADPNDARRRRFSPKFKAPASKNKRSH